MARVNTRFTPFTTNPVIGTAEYPDDIDVRNSEMESRMEEIDSIGQEMNDVVAEVNVLRNQAESVTTTAASSANTATQKASEASASANQAKASENAIKGYVIPSGASYSVDQLNTKYSAMTKAQFNALAEEKKANRAGSGFDSFGSNHATLTVQNVNNGIYTSRPSDGLPNIFSLSVEDITSQKTADGYPIVITNGVRQKLASTGGSWNKIALPTAPNIYPHDAVLTTEQIASGVIKHADSSNSGLVVMGKNLSGTTFNQSVPVVNGKKYIIEYVDNAVRKTLEITASSTSYIINLSGTNITEVGMYPTDAISRSDLSLAESWHEDVSEKGFGYPFGNTMYIGGNTDGLTGIANGSFSGFETYSLFGNWQTPSSLIGKGYVWSTLTEAQKRIFIANPENNCYLDGDKTIQVRYRVRVVQGLLDTGFNISAYNNYFNNPLSGGYVKPKGKQVSIASDWGNADSLGVYGQGTPAWVASLSTANEPGVFTASSSSGSTTGFLAGSYNGQCFAMPIALIHRRNQGMYHPVYNANGTKKASDGNFWYNTATSFTSISDCFNPAKLLTESGYIGSVSGRPDGLFYDQVHESDILDLRNSSKKPEDYNRLMTREFNKLVAGTNRGQEKEKVTEIKTQTTTGTVATVEVNNGARYKSGDVIYIYDLTASSVKGRFVVKSVSSNTLTVDSTFAKLANSYMISGASTTLTKSNTLLVCDVIGNVSNYPTSWKTNEIPFTTLHTAEDGASLLPDGTKDTFKLGRKANTTPLLCLRSTDSGVTWTSFAPTFSTTTNAITLTDEPSNNLVIVYYQTKTIMAVPTINNEVLETGKVLGTDGIANGALISTLIGKVPTANTAPYLQDGYNVSAYRIDATTLKFSTTSTETPTHSALSLAGGASGVPAVKVLPYLTRKNGKAYLNLVFKEMKHNGTSWGDDSKFNIVDNVSTTTDQNAQNIIYGVKEVELNLFIGADE